VTWVEGRRLRKWKELLASKPDDKYEDPKDVAAMEHAKKHMGDYKLKTADNYKVPDLLLFSHVFTHVFTHAFPQSLIFTHVFTRIFTHFTQQVPDHLRINADKKRRQMVLLEESVYSIKMSFNDRFLALRDLKVRMKNNIDAWSQRILEINDELGLASANFWKPTLPDSEFPEKRFEVTGAELDAAAGSSVGGGGGGAGRCVSGGGDAEISRGVRNVGGGEGGGARSQDAPRVREGEADGHDGAHGGGVR